MMNELPKAVTKLIERKINRDDVPGKMVDTKSRLEAKKEMRLKCLSSESSRKIEEVLGSTKRGERHTRGGLRLLQGR